MLIFIEQRIYFDDVNGWLVDIYYQHYERKSENIFLIVRSAL